MTAARSSRSSKVAVRKVQPRSTLAVEIPVPAFVATGIQTGRTSLRLMEGQAQTWMRDLRARGEREIESLRDRVPVDELVGRARDLEARTRLRAGEVAEEVERRLQELREKVLAVLGVASREQVDALVRELERLSRKLDPLLRQRRPQAQPTRKRAARARRGAARRRA